MGTIMKHVMRNIVIFRANYLKTNEHYFQSFYGLLEKSKKKNNLFFIQCISSGNILSPPLPSLPSSPRIYFAHQHLLARASLPGCWRMVKDLGGFKSAPPAPRLPPPPSRLLGKDKALCAADLCGEWRGGGARCSLI